MMNMNDFYPYFRYKKNVLEVSKRFMDRPQKPVDTAVWWTEYVLRQEDTSFMRPMSVNLAWYQRRQLDVWAFLILVVVIYLYCSVKILKYVFNKLVARPSSQSTKNKAKKAKLS